MTLEFSHKRLAQISRYRMPPSLNDVERLLSRSAGETLSFEEINTLINGIGSADFPRIKDCVIGASSELRREIFGSKIIPMAPVEVSNYCASDCQFCGWRSSNRDMERIRISEALVLAQIRYLIEKGIHYIELVGGDDVRFVRDILPSLIRSIRRLSQEMGQPVKICFCTMALTARQYATLREAGADSMIVWQETYDRDCYQRHVVRGPKAHGIGERWRVDSHGDGYSFRLHAQERALDAGLEVAIGAILGLNKNLNFEILATIDHARCLRDRYPIAADNPLIIGMPTWNPITTPTTDRRPAYTDNIDTYFSYIAALYLLALPYEDTWVFPNCRVDIDTQVESVQAAGVFTSTEVKLGPGGYLPALLASMRRRGESTAELEALIEAESRKQHVRPSDFLRALDKKEQFVHYYGVHEEYVRKFAHAGLDIVRGW